MKNWQLKTLGIILIIISLLINPYTLSQILKTDKHLELSNTIIIIIFEIFILFWGIICYFNRFNWFSKKISCLAIYIFEKNCIWLIIIQIGLLAFILFNNKDALLYQFNGDEPSYTQFSFASLKEILSQHRTFGLPLILKLFYFLFNDYQLWPYFQMLFYFASIFFLYWTFLKFGFSKILTLIVMTCLIWNSTVSGMFKYVLTEPLAASFLNFTIGSMFLVLRQNKWKLYLLLGFFTFFLYQIRPGFSFVPVLVPFWALGTFYIMKKSSVSKLRRNFIIFSTITIVPLLLICILRLIVVGQFGVLSSTGGYLSGHATHYLNENNIKYLSGDSRAIAEEILKRKRQLGFPCNLSPFLENPIPTKSRYFIEGDLCFGKNLMTAWLVAIKFKTGHEPFSDPSKNIEAWKHVQTLSGFFTIYNSEIDRLLMKYSKDILILEWKQYSKWIVGGSIHGIIHYLKSIWYRAKIWCIFLIFMGVLVKPYLYRKVHLDKTQIKQWNREVLVITVIGLSLFISGFFIVIIFNFPFNRLLNPLSQYLIPALILWVLPPIWLKNRSIRYVICPSEKT